MEIIYTSKAVEHLKYWRKSGNKIIQNKNSGTDKCYTIKPTRRYRETRVIKYSLSGVWSRRINQEHRLVYEVNDRNEIVILTIFSLRALLKLTNLLFVKF